MDEEGRLETYMERIAAYRAAVPGLEDAALERGRRERTELASAILDGLSYRIRTVMELVNCRPARDDSAVISPPLFIIGGGDGTGRYAGDFLPYSMDLAGMAVWAGGGLEEPGKFGIYTGLPLCIAVKAGGGRYGHTVGSGCGEGPADYFLPYAAGLCLVGEDGSTKLVCDGKRLFIDGSYREWNASCINEEAPEGSPYRYPIPTEMLAGYPAAFASFEERFFSGLDRVLGRTEAEA